MPKADLLTRNVWLDFLSFDQASRYKFNTQWPLQWSQMLPAVELKNKGEIKNYPLLIKEQTNT